MLGRSSEDQKADRNAESENSAHKVSGENKDFIVN
jgi:hypothetical protein